MKEHLQGIRKTFNLYTTTLGLLVLGVMVYRFNMRFKLQPEGLKLLGFDMHREYVSAIIGLLFGVFVIVLALQIRLFRESLRMSLPVEARARQGVIAGIVHFPWVASPFRTSGLGLRLFWGGVACGYLILLFVTAAHIFVLVTVEEDVRGSFQVIGLFDLAVAVAAVPVLRWIRSDVDKVTQMLRSKPVGGPLSGPPETNSPR